MWYVLVLLYVEFENFIEVLRFVEELVLNGIDDVYYLVGVIVLKFEEWERVYINLEKVNKLYLDYIGVKWVYSFVFLKFGYIDDVIVVIEKIDVFMFEGVELLFDIVSYLYLWGDK